MSKIVFIEELRGLLTKTYDEEEPKTAKWAEFQNNDVTFIDPTQETKGLESYFEVQEKFLLPMG